MSRFACGVLAVGLFAAAGCGAGGVDVTGKVTKGSDPYTLAEGEAISINLALEGGGAHGSGTVEKDGSFVVKGEKGGVLPGKYKVTLTHYLPAGAKKGAAPPATKTANETWDVGGASKEFTIDMAKYK